MAKIVVETNGAQEMKEEAENKIKSGIQWVKEHPLAVGGVIGGVALGILGYRNVKLNKELKTIKKMIKRHPTLFQEQVKRTWYQKTPMTEEQFNAIAEAMELAFEQCMKTLNIEYLNMDGTKG